MKLPLLLSVPHGGLETPAEVMPYARLTPAEIEADGDVGAAAIYTLEAEVAAYHATPVARAFVDQNRAADDRRKDGVVKTHTCWDVPIYEPTPPEDVFATLLRNHYHPYHRRLTDLATGGVRLGIDCHTMAAHGPPVGPDPGKERPAACLSHADGTCPDAWIATLRDTLQDALGRPVRINDPFRGGHIIRAHAAELPWLQLELSRAPFASHAEKRDAVLRALTGMCHALEWI